MSFHDEYVGSAKVISDHTGKNDHQIVKIDKPKIRELNSSSFTPREFRLPDSVNNNMFTSIKYWELFTSLLIIMGLTYWCCKWIF